MSLSLLLQPKLINAPSMADHAETKLSLPIYLHLVFQCSVADTVIILQISKEIKNCLHMQLQHHYMVSKMNYIYI